MKATCQSLDVLPLQRVHDLLHGNDTIKIILYGKFEQTANSVWHKQLADSSVCKRSERYAAISNYMKLRSFGAAVTSTSFRKTELLEFVLKVTISLKKRSSACLCKSKEEKSISVPSRAQNFRPLGNVPHSQPESWRRYQ